MNLARRPALLALAGLVFSLGACERATTPPPGDAPSAKTAATAPAIVARRVPPRAPTGTRLDRDDPLAIRLMTYNVKWNSVFPDVNATRAAGFARMLKALDPDVLALEEIGQAPGDQKDTPAGKRRTADDAAKLVAAALPLPEWARWHAYQAGDNVIVSKYPLHLEADQTNPPAQRALALALVDLPADLSCADLYVIASHHKCCGGDENEGKRQQQSDAIAAWLRDARTPGGHVDLPPQTPIIITGDFNLVGGPGPLETLLTGDISQEQKYGPDFVPDWDDTPLADAHPLHNVTGSEDWTWRDDTTQFKPARLDYILYSDSVLELVKTFALDTTTLPSDELLAAGLERPDSVAEETGGAYDHLPLIADFRPRLQTSGEVGSGGEGGP